MARLDLQNKATSRTLKGSNKTLQIKTKVVWKEITWPLFVWKKTGCFALEHYVHKFLESDEGDEFWIKHFEFCGYLLSLLENGITRKQEINYKQNYYLELNLKIRSEIRTDLGKIIGHVEV